MAVGDITTIITANMAQNDTTDRQPSSGVEELWLDVGDVDQSVSNPDELPFVELHKIDGTNNESLMLKVGMAKVWWKMKMVADNTNYFRLTHKGATTGDYQAAYMVVG